jgi:hypothetical protein
MKSKLSIGILISVMCIFTLVEFITAVDLKYELEFYRDNISTNLNEFKIKDTSSLYIDTTRNIHNFNTYYADTQLPIRKRKPYKKLIEESIIEPQKIIPPKPKILIIKATRDNGK